MKQRIEHGVRIGICRDNIAPGDFKLSRIARLVIGGILQCLDFNIDADLLQILLIDLQYFDVVVPCRCDDFEGLRQTVRITGFRHLSLGLFHIIRRCGSRIAGTEHTAGKQDVRYGGAPLKHVDGSLRIKRIQNGLAQRLV